MHITTRKLTAAAVTGAAYAALTMLLAPISYGAIQCRVSEVLCILPFFIPCTAWGLFAGCAIANLLSAAGILDVIFGSLATLLAALCTAWLGRGRGAQSWVRPWAGNCVRAGKLPADRRAADAWHRGRRHMGKPASGCAGALPRM